MLDRLKNMDLEKTGQVLNDDWNLVCEITCDDKSNGWTVGEILPWSKGGVGGGRDRGLGARVLAVEQPTEVESQVAAVV